jgi:16S rRNA A1518/A1519 N6-dimethyltransferase RsmA/KsgA/DIM1 with predicted DNA glycosylase/AP lyase activity
MTVRLDPEGNETRALFEMEDFAGKQVLEIGSGDGRLTWLYADRAEHVTAVEPFAQSYERAKSDLPPELEAHVELQNMAFLDFAARSENAKFDTAIFSWSL